MGTIKFKFKVKDNEDKGSKLMGVASCEKNMPKLTTRFYPRQVKSAIKIVPMSRLMSTNSKASCLTKVLSDQSKITHSLKKSEMSRLAKDFSFMQTLENEEVITCSLLDHKLFYGEKTRFEEFWDCLKNIVIEYYIAENKRHNEWGYFLDSLSIRHWKELTFFFYLMWRFQF